MNLLKQLEEMEAKSLFHLLYQTALENDRGTKLMSFLKYPGSKNNMADELNSREPLHTNYIEPFMGSAAKFFRKRKVSGIIVLNDIYGELSNVFEHLILNPEKLIISAQFMINSRRLWEKWSKELELRKSKSSSQLGIIDAIKFLFVNLNSFTGDGSSFKSKMQFRSSTLVSKLIAASKKLEDVIIENLDFRECIERYNKHINTHFYIDPPYTVATKQSLYKYNFNNQDHIDLKLLCDQIDKSNNTFLLSYDYEKDIKELYSSDYYIEELKFDYKMGNRLGGKIEKKTELIISNYYREPQLTIGFKNK